MAGLLLFYAPEEPAFQLFCRLLRWAAQEGRIKNQGVTGSVLFVVLGVQRRGGGTPPVPRAQLLT